VRTAQQTLSNSVIQDRSVNILQGKSQYRKLKCNVSTMQNF